MSVQTRVLTSDYSDTNAVSYTTASISPSAGKVVVVIVGHDRGSSSPVIPTLSGASTTWVQAVTSIDGEDRRRITMFTGVAAGSGAITISFSETMLNCHWHIVQLQKTPIGSNGTNAFVQTDAEADAGATTSLTSTLAAFSSTENATIGSIFINTVDTIGSGSGFTRLAQTNSATETTMDTQYKDTSDTTVDWNWTSSSRACAVSAEIELKEAGSLLSILL